MCRYNKNNYLCKCDTLYDHFTCPFVILCLFYLNRCGMVFVDPEELKWLPFTQTWMNGYADKVKDEIREYILELFVRYVDDGLNFVRKKCQQSINQVILYFYFVDLYFAFLFYELYINESILLCDVK